MKSEISIEQSKALREDAEHKIAEILKNLEKYSGCKVDEVTFYTQEIRTTQGKFADKKFVEIRLCV